MKVRRRVSRLVCAVTIVAAASVMAVAHADAPGPDFDKAAAAAAKRSHGRKHKTAKAPKASLACKADDDCALTNLGDGQCCPTLCQPRAVSKASAEALKKWSETCEKPKGRDCPELSCAPPRLPPVAACVNRTCVVKAASPASRD